MKALKVIAATLAFTLITSPAFAHTHLEKTVPANASTVAIAPKELSLAFEHEVQLTAVTVESADGKKESLKPLPATKVKQATLPLPALAAGAYTVNWRAMGADGHVMSGKFTFTISAAK